MVEKSGVEMSSLLKDIKDFSTPWFKNSWLKSPGLKISWLKSLGLKGLGLKLGVEKSRVEMSFNPPKDPYGSLFSLLSCMVMCWFCNVAVMDLHFQIAGWNQSCFCHYNSLHNRSVFQGHEGNFCNV